MTIARLFTLLALIMAAALATAAPAAADKPCWVKLVNDWFDGRIDGTYPAKCYRDALKNLNEDLRGYSDAEEDIRRALLAATREKGREFADAELVPPQSGETVDGAPRDGDEPDEGVAVPPGSGGGGDGGLLDVFKPSNADSVPIPLLVLAGLALILLAAAATSFVARRIQARRMRVTPLPRVPHQR